MKRKFFKIGSKMSFQIFSTVMVSVFVLVTCCAWVVNINAQQDPAAPATAAAQTSEPAASVAAVNLLETSSAGATAQDAAKVTALATQIGSLPTALAVKAAALPEPDPEPEQPEPEEPAFTWQEEAFQAVRYLTSVVNRRSQPTTNSDKLGTLSWGSKVQIVAKTDQGFVKLDDGSYITDQYLSESEPAKTPTYNNQGSAYVNADAQTVLNTAPVNPRSTGSSMLDTEINNIFARIHTPGMDMYAKVKACYDYLISNTSYQRNMPLPAVDGNNSYINSAAYGCLTTGLGSCNRYSAAFIAMMTRLGFDARYVEGQCTSAGGGYTGHVWVEVYINGTAFVFDPQVEDNIAGGGAIQYLRFCKTYAQVPGKYIK